MFASRGLLLPVVAILAYLQSVTLSTEYPLGKFQKFFILYTIRSKDFHSKS